MPYHHLAGYHLPKLQGYPRLLISQTLGSLGSSMVTIFVPIFFMKELGFSLPQILLWYLLYIVAAIPMLYAGAWLASRFGANKLIALGLVSHAASIISVIYISSSDWLIWLSALLVAAYRGFFWPAWHVYFSKVKRPDGGGEQISQSMSLVLLTHSLAPAFAGITADIIGISTIYAIGVCLLLLATIPIVTGPELIKKRPLNMRLLSFQKVRNDLAANTGEATTMMVEILIWPLLIYFIVGSYSSIGLLSSVALLAAIFTTMYVGRRERTQGEKHYLREGVAFQEFSNVLRLIATTPVAIFAANSVSGVARALKNTPFITRYYQLANQEPRIEYILAFEIAFQAGLILITTLLLILSQFFSNEALLLTGIAITMPLNLLILKIR